jgi:hypothetical protein
MRRSNIAILFLLFIIGSVFGESPAISMTIKGVLCDPYSKDIIGRVIILKENETIIIKEFKTIEYQGENEYGGYRFPGINLYNIILTNIDYSKGSLLYAHLPDGKVLIMSKLYPLATIWGFTRADEVYQFTMIKTEEFNALIEHPELNLSGMLSTYINNKILATILIISDANK